MKTWRTVTVVGMLAMAGFASGCDEPEIHDGRCRSALGEQVSRHGQICVDPTLDGKRVAYSGSVICWFGDPIVLQDHATYPLEPASPGAALDCTELPDVWGVGYCHVTISVTGGASSEQSVTLKEVPDCTFADPAVVALPRS